MSIGGTIETYWKSTTMIPTVGNSPYSLVTSSSLGQEFIELICQATKDNVIVVYSDWFVKVGTISLPISSLTYEKLVEIFGKSNLCFEEDNTTSFIENQITKHFFTLSEALVVFFILYSRCQKILVLILSSNILLKNNVLLLTKDLQS
jgi:hypothetical protein